MKFEGGGIVGELSAVNQRQADVPVTYQDSALNLSLTAPPDWIFFRSEEEKDKGSVRIVILDSEAAATSFLNVQSLEVKPGAKQSARFWAELKTAEAAKVLKNFQIRGDSWKERTVSGQPGVSVIGDFVEGQDKKIAYGVYALVNTNALEFLLRIKAKDFEGFRPKFDALVDSCKIK